jgi:hypothetical protein
VLQREKMKRLVGFCISIVLVGLASGLSTDLKKDVENVESLLDSLKKLNSELKSDSSALKSSAKTKYESRSDIFVDQRWHPVHSKDQRQTSRSSGVTEQQKNECVDKHNDLRRGEGSSSMFKLRWNDQLANLGQQWSDRCVFEHGQPWFDSNSLGYKDLGQNIWAHTSPDFDIKKAVQDWFDEKSDYYYDSKSCNSGKVCGHYTAVVWDDTKEVGCGVTLCGSISGMSNAHFIVCNYGPPGNWAGDAPFEKGTPCTQCGTGKFYCNNGLCDDTCNSEGPNCQCAASCKNGGQAQGNCGCQCSGGFTGPDCSKQCADIDPQCGANPGYPDVFCDFPGFEFMHEKCPKLCKQCSAKKSDDKLSRLISYLKEEADDK